MKTVLRSLIAVLLAVFLWTGCNNAQNKWSFSSVGKDTDWALRDEAQKSLGNLVGAYTNRNATQFMDWVSSDYLGTAAVLDSRIRRSFVNYFYIELDWTITSVIASSDKNTLAVNVQFRRKLGRKETGEITPDWASTSVLLRKDGDVYKLLQQNSPVLFL